MRICSHSLYDVSVVYLCHSQSYDLDTVVEIRFDSMTCNLFPILFAIMWHVSHDQPTAQPGLERSVETAVKCSTASRGVVKGLTRGCGR